MAIVSVSQVKFSGNGSGESVDYFNGDLQTLLAQTNAASVQPVNVVVLVTIDGITGGSVDAQCTAMIAVDSNNALLNAPGNQLALPCPKYCRSGV